jgi:hypothetical protein
MRGSVCHYRGPEDFSKDVRSLDSCTIVHYKFLTISDIALAVTIRALGEISGNGTSVSIDDISFLYQILVLGI